MIGEVICTCSVYMRRETVPFGVECLMDKCRKCTSVLINHCGRSRLIGSLSAIHPASHRPPVVTPRLWLAGHEGTASWGTGAARVSSDVAGGRVVHGASGWGPRDAAGSAGHAR